MMNFKLNFKKTAFFFLFFSLFLPLVSFAVLDPKALVYTPMEEIPGFGKPASYGEYIGAIYNFGIWTIGISAVLMISIGAFMYIGSAGNTSTAGKAKGIITDAIAGVILAMISYVLIYTINPALVDIKGVDKMISDAARSYDGTYPKIDSPLPSDCNSAEWQAIFTQVAGATGLDKCLIAATAAIESGCKQQPSRTNSGQDCGVMQTRASACPTGATTCDDLEQHPEKAVACGAAYLKQNYVIRAGRDANPAQVIRDRYAGYNGGPGALAISSSCVGMTNSYGYQYEKWDCPIECKGYCVVPARTSVVLNFYNKCKGGTPLE